MAASLGAASPVAAIDRSGEENVLVFYRQELEYAAYLDAGEAFVCNNRRYGPSAHRVHHSSCRMLESAGWARDGVRTVVKKACARQLPVLVDWLTQAFGAEGTGFQYCRFCNPVSRV